MEYQRLLERHLKTWMYADIAMIFILHSAQVAKTEHFFMCFPSRA